MSSVTTQLYRVRYTAEASGRVRAADVMSSDVSCALADLPERLPAGSYVLSIEDVAAGRDVHWTRWPTGFRPGARNGETGRIFT